MKPIIININFVGDSDHNTEQVAKTLQQVQKGLSSPQNGPTEAFTGSWLHNLNDDQLHFLSVFVHCEGKIKDVEKALGVSYPTVKSQLAQLNQAMEQATDLIEALGVTDQPRHAEQNNDENHCDDKYTTSSDLSATIGQFVTDQLKQVGISTDKSHDSRENEDNCFNLSKFDRPTGKDFEFQRNSITMSKFGGVIMNSSSMCDWSINASNVQSVILNRSNASEVGVHGSSLSGLSLDDSTFSDITLNGCKVNHLELTDFSHLADIKLHGASWKNLTLKKSRLSGLSLNGCKCNNLKLDNSLLEDLHANASNFSGCVFIDCELSDGTFKNCHLENVTFKGFSWSGFSLNNVRIYNEVIESKEDFERLCIDSPS